MSLIVLASAKASPGVTTACVALSAVWPDSRQVRIVEADPDGGVLAARLGLPSEPGLSTLAVSGRRSLTGDVFAQHIQVLSGGEVGVLLAPPTAEQVHRSLGLLGGRLAALLTRPQTADTLVDAGRLRQGAAAWPLVESADAVLLVARPRLDELQQLPARLRSLRTTSARAGLILIGDSPYPPSEVAAALHVEVVGVLADDPRGAAAINGQAHHTTVARSQTAAQRTGPGRGDRRVERQAHRCAGP